MQRGRLFLFWTKKNIYTKMFYLYLQSSSASRQPKISNLMFLANPVYRVRSHPSAWHLKTFQWHGWTRSSNNSIFLFEIYQFFVGKYSTFIFNPQVLLESEKIPALSVSLTLVHRVRRDSSVTLRKFSPGSLTFFHISLWKILISIGNILSWFRILKCI